jgi:hypothetical protein
MLTFNYQEIKMNNEHNKIIEKAKSLPRKDLIRFLLIHKRILLQNFPFEHTKEELIDMYCEVILDKHI